MPLAYLYATFTNRCPRCRQGKLFKPGSAYNLKHNLDMPEHCPVCGQATEIEPGFYYGTGYVSYALTVALTVASFIAWKVLIGLSFDIDDNRIFYWMGCHFVLLFGLQPLLMRLSRSIWLSWFVPFDKNWKKN